MRGARAAIPCLVAALALAGCMGRTAPVAVAPQPTRPSPMAKLGTAPAPMPVAYAARTGPL